MAHYQLDDPRLQDVLDKLAARDAEDWPLDDRQRAVLARILPQRLAKPVSRVAVRAPQKQAA